MSKEIFLHIGTNKTGTTSIQHQLFHDRAELLKMGISYPLETKAHHHLFRNNKNGELKLRMDEWSQLMRSIQAATIKKAIISSEGFSKGYANIDVEGLNQIKDKLKEYDLNIILYLRKQHSFLESYYSQLLKHGVRFSDHLLEETIENTNLDYHKMLLKWMSVFGKEQIKVFSFESIDSKNLVKTFYDHVGIPINPLEKAPANRKPSLDQIRCFYEIHRVISENNLIIKNLTKDVYLNLLRHSKNWEGPIHNYKLIPFERAQNIFQKYRESNKKLIEMFPEDNLHRLLDEPKPYEHSDISFKALPEQQWAAGIEFIKKFVYPDYSPK